MDKMNKELFLGPAHGATLSIEELVIIIALIIVAFFIMAIIFSIIDDIAASKEKKKEKMKVIELESELKTVKEKLVSLESNIGQRIFKLMPPTNPYCITMVNCARVNFIEIKPTEKAGRTCYTLSVVHNPYYPPLWQKDTYWSVAEAFDEAKKIFGDLLSDDIQKEIATPFELWMSQTKRDNEKHKIVDDFPELFEDRQIKRIFRRQ